jgi:ferredoxin
LCFSQPSPAETAAQEFHHAGHININLLKMLLPLKPFDFYICGPSPMMETLVPALEDWGVPESRIHYEAFGPAAVKNRRQKIAAGAQEVNSNDPEIVITFARSGRQVPWQPSASSLLEFAEGNGIAVDSGCRSGSCGTCQTKMSAGEIVYHHAPDFDPEPGTCLLCISAPKTSLTLEV